MYTALFYIICLSIMFAFLKNHPFGFGNLSFNACFLMLLSMLSFQSFAMITSVHSTAAIDVCTDCHQEQVHNWQKSDHAKAMALATTDTVLGDFNNAETKHFTQTARFYKKGGAKAVLSEIRRIKSDYVQSAYFKLLLERNLSTNDLVNVIETAGNTINSDYYLAQILKKNQKAFLKNDKTVDAYISAAKNINSDHYLTSIVKTVIGDRSISDKQLGSLLKVSENINSDHYLTTILKEIMDKRELNTQNMDKIMNLSKSINSDHYKTVVLKKALKNYQETLEVISEKLAEKTTSVLLTRFFCGLPTPLFTRLKVRHLQGFAHLEKYRFAQAQEWLRGIFAKGLC